MAVPHLLQGPRGPPPWHMPRWRRHPWMRYVESGVAGLGVVLATLYVASAIAAGLVAYILYNGYRVSGDRRLLVMSLGFIMVALGSILDLVSGVTMLSVSWAAYLAGYTAIALASAPEKSRASLLAIILLPSGNTALELAGSVVAGVFGLAAFERPSLVRVQGILLAMSHFAEAASLLLGCPLLLVAAVALRAASLASMTIPLALAVRGA